MWNTPAFASAAALVLTFPHSIQSFGGGDDLSSAFRSLPFMNPLPSTGRRHLTNNCPALHYSFGDKLPGTDRKDKDDEEAELRKEIFRAANWNDPTRRLRKRQESQENENVEAGDEREQQEAHKSAAKNNRLKTDFRLFLTQRALQSFSFLSKELHDPHTVTYLEDSGNYTDLVEYHGLGALVNTTWDGFFFDLMEKPRCDVMIMVQKNRRMGSKNNPYLNGDEYVEVPIPIDPTSVSSRILSVREQIASEMVVDLQACKNNGILLLDNFLESIENNHERENLVFERLSTFFLDYVNDPSGEGNFLSSSPLRKSNFDLLTLLATQESIHRVIQDYKEEGSAMEPTRDWFKQFYFARLESHFDGLVLHGRADAFFDELISTPPVNVRRNRLLSKIDPINIAKQIISKRGEVVDGWLEVVESIGEEHAPIRRSLLEKQMGL